MEDEDLIVDEESSEVYSFDHSSKIYEKGYPFHKLRHKEYNPKMNLLHTFHANTPNHEDFLKNVERDQWPKPCVDAFLLILTDVKKFAESKQLTNCQTAALYEIFYSCFNFFAMLPALKKDKFLEYFRDTLLLYLVQDPAESLRIFNGKTGFAIAKLFHQLLANNFEMMKYVLLPVYRIEIGIKEGD